MTSSMITAAMQAAIPGGTEARLYCFTACGYSGLARSRNAGT